MAVQARANVRLDTPHEREVVQMKESRPRNVQPDMAKWMSVQVE